MISAFQAEIVAYSTDGGIIHDKCLPDEVLEAAEEAALEANQARVAGFRVFDETIQNLGYSPLSRYHLGEVEASYAYEAEEYDEDVVRLMGEVEKLNLFLDIVEDLQAHLDEDGYNSTGVFVADREDLANGVKLVEDYQAELEAEAEERIKTLSATYCDSCMEVIE